MKKGTVALFLSALVILGLIGAVSCKRKNSDKFKYDAAGYYYNILSFEDKKYVYEPGCIAHVAALFATLNDSVFWDSHNNFNDRFYITIDSATRKNLLNHAISKSVEGDSLELMIDPTTFFRDQFNSTVPFFCAGDSAVRVRFKLKQLLCSDAVAALAKNLELLEGEKIRSYFKNASQMRSARDEEGVYWISKEGRGSVKANIGEPVKITYQGSFLNGRFLERSPENFEITYGTPDQLLSGLNYVIGRLKFGQTAKIILPSRLAFGESGSSNGTVPPYTPLIYEVKIDSAN